MAKEKKPSFGLKSIDDIFSTQEMRDDEKLAKIREISLSEERPPIRTITFFICEPLIF